MKKLELKSYSRAVELVGLMIGLYLCRGLWGLTGYWILNEYIQFEILRLLVTGVVLINILGFIRTKMVGESEVQSVIQRIRILEGVQMGVMMLATGNSGIRNYEMQLIVVALLVLGIYIHSLVVLFKSKYQNVKKVKYFRLYIVSILCINSLSISLGVAVGLTGWEILFAGEFFLAIIPCIVLIWYLKQLDKLETTPEEHETQEWKPE